MFSWNQSPSVQLLTSTINNECYLVIGSVKMIELPDDIINDQGQINLESSGAIGISGLNSYFNLNKIESHPYVGNNQIPNF